MVSKVFLVKNELKNKFLGQKNICHDFSVTAVIEIDAKQATCQLFFKKKEVDNISSVLSAVFIKIEVWSRGLALVR
jgi:hypothetical protein